MVLPLNVKKLYNEWSRKNVYDLWMQLSYCVLPEISMSDIYREIMEYTRNKLCGLVSEKELARNIGAKCSRKSVIVTKSSVFSIVGFSKGKLTSVCLHIRQT